MNRVVTFLAVCAALLTTAAATQAAFAQSTLSEGKTDLIRHNCSTIQTTLQQLRVSDAGLRTDRGQLYENISTRLMTPLNIRIASDRLDGLELGSIALKYNNQLELYREKYREYERALTRTIQASCNSEVEVFYERLNTARDLRGELHEATNELIDLLKEYRAEFEDFASKNGGDR